MKFTVEVEEFWLEEEELSETLALHIRNEVVSQIKKSMQDQIETAITNNVKLTVKSMIEPVIQEKLSELCDTGVIRPSPSKEILISDYIKEEFERNHGWNNPKDKINKIAKRFGEEFRTRYDMVFANAIVRGLKDQGMLKDDVVERLLDHKPN